MRPLCPQEASRQAGLRPPVAVDQAVGKTHTVRVVVSCMSEQGDNASHCGWSDTKQVAGSIGFGLARLVDLGLDLLSPLPFVVMTARCL